MDLEQLLIASIFLLTLGLLCFVAFVMSVRSKGTYEDSGRDRSPSNGRITVKGKRVMSKKKEDPFAVFVKQMNEIRDQEGLPRLPIETIHGAFGQMSPEFLKQLEIYIGPIYKENVSGWASLMLEMIGEHNKDLGGLSIEENRWSIEHIRLKDAGKFAARNLAVALEDADAVVGVFADHGEEKPEDVRRALHRILFKQLIIDDYLLKLPGAQKNPELIEAAMQEILGYLPENPRVQLLQGEGFDGAFGSNGNRQRGKEFRR